MKFSVVISAYNVEAFMENILECLLRQTYEDFQVIVVDDCATDATGELADQFVGKFADRAVPYQVIHKPVNQGLSMARNTGLDHADGEYVLFWDGDDLVEDNTLETIAQALGEYTVDFLVYGYTEDYYKGDEVSYRVKKSPEEHFFVENFGEINPAQESQAQSTAQTSATGALGPEALVRAFPYITELEQETMFGYAWNKVFRREFLLEHNLRYQTITHVEDVLFNLQVVEHMESMLAIEDNLYHYCNRGQARLTSKYLPEYFDLQKKRYTAFLSLQKEKMHWAEDTQQPMTGREIAHWQQQVKDTMAAAYFRAFQSSMVREIAHGTKKKDILAMAERERTGKLYPELKDHLNTESRMAKILYAPLAKGKFATAYYRGKLICFVQKYFAGTYAKLKQNR